MTQKETASLWDINVEGWPALPVSADVVQAVLAGDSDTGDFFTFDDAHGRHYIVRKSRIVGFSQPK